MWAFARRTWGLGLLLQTDWRRERDSNPRQVALRLISSQVPSTTRPSLQDLTV